MKGYVYASVLHKELSGYTKLRESRGFSSNCNHILQKLDKYLISENVNEKVLTPSVVDGFLAAHKPGRSISTMTNFASICSIFSKYLGTLGIAAFVPEHIKPSSNYIPYIFSENEIADIFTAADNLKVCGNTEMTKLTRLQFPMLLRLLYGCGLRLNEALTLHISNVDLNNGVLHVLNAKGCRDRLVPMDAILTDILKRYCETILSDADDSQALFAGTRNARYRSKCWARTWFEQVLQETGIDRQPSLGSSGRGICLHCLRHTFCVHSFRNQDLAGVDNYRAAPPLSIYVGHHRLTGTEKYLHMTAENSEDIIAATSAYSEGMFPEVPQ